MLAARAGPFLDGGGSRVATPCTTCSRRGTVRVLGLRHSEMSAPRVFPLCSRCKTDRRSRSEPLPGPGDPQLLAARFAPRDEFARNLASNGDAARALTYVPPMAGRVAEDKGVWRDIVRHHRAGSD